MPAACSSGVNLGAVAATPEPPHSNVIVTATCSLASGCRSAPRNPLIRARSTRVPVIGFTSSDTIFTASVLAIELASVP